MSEFNFFNPLKNHLNQPFFIKCRSYFLGIFLTKTFKIKVLFDFLIFSLYFDNNSHNYNFSNFIPHYQQLIP